MAKNQMASNTHVIKVPDVGEGIAEVELGRAFRGGRFARGEGLEATQPIECDPKLLFVAGGDRRGEADEFRLGGSQSVGPVRLPMRPGQ